MKIKVKSTATPFLNIRSSASVNSTVIGKALPGTELEVDKIVNGWAFLPITTNGMRLGGWAFVSAQFLESSSDTPSIPDPVVRTENKLRLGLHVMSNVGHAIAEAGKGCRYFMVMNNNLGAHQLKTAFPDAVVMSRFYIGRNRLSADDLIRALQVYPESELVYTGHNEQDIIGTSPDAIRERSQFDAEVAQKIKIIAPKAKYAAATWSMGEPDVSNPEIIKAIKDYYAPHFNSGLFGLDQHSYSQTAAWADWETEWLVRRWEKYFTLCGFNPNRGQSIYMGETGCDDGKQNGFRGQGASADQFKAWCRKFIEVGKRDIVIDGKSYPSPLVGGAIFQVGGNGDPQWNRFEMSGYLDSMKEFYGTK